MLHAEDDCKLVVGVSNP